MIIMTKYKAKSVTISRKPRIKPDGFKSAWIGLFEENNPHLKGRVPFKVLEIPEIEKVRINELKNISYYLMGNDIVINDLTEVTFDQKDNILTLTGKQKL